MEEIETRLFSRFKCVFYNCRRVPYTYFKSAVFTTHFRDYYSNYALNFNSFKQKLM